MSDDVEQLKQQPPRRRRQRALQPRPPTPAVPDAAGGLLPTRDRLLALAGYDEREQAELLRAAVEETRRHLNAVAPMRLVVAGARGEGSHVEEFHDVDAGLRLRAADQLISLVGGYPSKSASVSGDKRTEVVVRIADLPGRAEVASVQVDGVEVVLPPAKSAES